MDEVAVAVADPVRRHILTLLRDEPLTAGEIARRFTISRPAISRHLRVLRESGLVRDEVVGRQRIYRLDPAPLAPLVGWLTGLAGTDRWARHLDALETEIYRTRRERRDRAPAAHRRDQTA
ncbi:metalloregulator ArsR/SmtB family transcription factor [Micromonospora sp. WMMD1120]|uniref:metalloregulator ArsR/SmtB family transcription factor n=1 Tax=Micromonospora sp. WMMD1120 TaxID=3016106 RepID=UPI00241763D3|nr:metalloregulator ArsR/SmtB family transcription factor [Micromonospora sp. WMMD1120]MDG4809977.1 metalloregulator ArsR/SmtB family transcription factor [Micromonospora sp. WMMD1120]